MTTITTEDIKALRDVTGVSIMQCKKALEEAQGDIEKAKVILRKASAISAAKKADRELGAGVVSAYVHAGGTVLGAVVLACETDFVSKNEEFSKLAYSIAMQVAALAPSFKSLISQQPRRSSKPRRRMSLRPIAPRPSKARSTHTCASACFSNSRS